MSILQLNDIHIVEVLSFVNECRSGRIPDIYLDHDKVREIGLELRNNLTLNISRARADVVLRRCDIKGSRLRNTCRYFDTVNSLLFKMSFRECITKYFFKLYLIGWFSSCSIIHHFTASLNICIEHGPSFQSTQC